MASQTPESVQDETETAEQAVAEQTSSPEVTDDGAPSSGAATEEQDHGELARAEFLKRWGSDEPEADEADGAADEGAETPDEATAEDAKVEQKQEIAEADDGEDEEFRLSDKEFKSLPDGVRKRIGHLNARVKKTEREMGEMQTQLETARDAEQRLGQLRQFAEENQMTVQDVTLGLGTMAKFATGDWKGFVEDIKPLYDKALQASGQAISDDLREQVANGYLTEEAARELTQARISTDRARQESERLRQSQSQMTEQQQRQQQVHDIVSAVNSREEELRKSDPDYARKAPVVKRIMEFALQNGAQPRTREQAVKMVNDAYEQATASMPKADPKPTPPRPSTSTVSRGHPEPRTLEDALAASPPPHG